jgi:DHA2 family multidrug resistance protein
MLCVGIGALQYVLDKGQEDDWFSSRAILTLTIVAVATLVLLVIHELRVKDPVVDLRVFKERSFATGVFLMTVLGFVLYGSMVLLPIMLQTLWGYPSVQAGIAMAPRGLGSFVMMQITGQLVGRMDPRKLLIAGLTIGGITLLWLSPLLALVAVDLATRRRVHWIPVVSSTLLVAAFFKVPLYSAPLWRDVGSALLRPFV